MHRAKRRFEPAAWYETADKAAVERGQMGPALAVSISAPLWIIVAVVAIIVIAFLLMRGRR